MNTDNALFTGKVDGKSVTLKAAHLRNPCYKPELTGKKLFIGLPIYQQMPTFFAQCMMALQAQKPLPMAVHICQGDGVARSRNTLTAEFLRSDCTHLLFIDSDLIFSAEHIARLLTRNVSVVGGFYPKKQDGKLEWVINTLPNHPPVRPDGLQSVRYVGTGFLCVERSVFVAMAEKYPEIAYREDYGDRLVAHDFWPMGVYRKNASDEGRYLSEDWYFCQRWLDMGGEVFADTVTVLKHIGPIIFPLQSQEPEITNPRASKPEPTSDHAVAADRSAPVVAESIA